VDEKEQLKLSYSENGKWINKPVVIQRINDLFSALLNQYILVLPAMPLPVTP
jgi:hypothetical protein